MRPLIAANAPDAGLEISASGVILFLAVGLGLFGLFQGLRYLNRVSRQTKRRAAALETTLTIVETVAGLAFVVGAVPMLFSGRPEYSPYFAMILVVAVLWVCWVAIRDLVHGIFFKAGRVCRAGDELTVGDIRGRVRRLGYRVLEVATPEGEQVLLPYSKLTKATVTRRSGDVGAVRHAFTLAPPAAVSLASVTEAVALAALTHHWASVAHPPEVTLTEAGTLKIGLYALDPLRGPEIEAAVRQAVAALQATS